jgi:Coenzyme PQQ synthesis protein D (PqqD)
MQEIKFRQTDGMIFDDMEGQFTVYHPQNGAFFALNSTGVILWQALQNWVGYSELQEILIQRFAVSNEVADADSKYFLEAIEARGLIERSSKTQKAKLALV